MVPPPPDGSYRGRDFKGHNQPRACSPQGTATHSSFIWQIHAIAVDLASINFNTNYIHTAHLQTRYAPSPPPCWVVICCVGQYKSHWGNTAGQSSRGTDTVPSASRTNATSKFGPQAQCRGPTAGRTPPDKIWVVKAVQTANSMGPYTRTSTM